MKPLLFKLLAHGASEGSVIQHGMTPHPHQRAGEQEIRRDADQQHGGNQDYWQVTKCNQLLPIMKDPIGDGARQSNSQAEGERQLSPQRAFEKPETSQAIGVSGNELKVQARRQPQESQPEQLPPQPEKAQVKNDGIADKRCPRTGR